MIADETSNGTPQPLLAVRGVSVRYHEHDPAGPGADPATRVAGHPTPDDVTFDVRPGEAVLLLGPSGCGKSTLALATNGLVQPGLKVRGREYLRIIYGPEYTEERHLERLRERSLGRKRSLALREYALGLEALDRVARGEPTWRVHEPVFAVLAMESEPVDPRL